MADDRPGKGLFGWLGRQFGHIKKAVQTDPAKPGPQVVYRENRTEEQQLPDQPGMKFRRTGIDEVIVDGPPPGIKDRSSGAKESGARSQEPGKIKNAPRPGPPL